MRRLLGGSLAAVAALLLTGLFSGAAHAATLNCSEPYALCAETVDSIGYGGEYTGHDEPSLLFYSNTAGSGNSNMYHLQIPSDPKVMPNQAGTAGTWNFQLHPAFWLGMALCDNQSAPEFTHAPCVPDSDTNIFDGTNPAGPDYIGKHPGTAFLELQFYPPGWAPWPPGVSCDASQVVRRDGDLQLQLGSEQRRQQQRLVSEFGRRRAGELRVRHHELAFPMHRPRRLARRAGLSRRTPRRTCS